MITANEIQFCSLNNHETIASWYVKLVISIITGLLLISWVYYHRLSMEIFAVRNGLKDRRIGLTNDRLFKIALELAICTVHAMPRQYPKSLNFTNDTISMKSYPLTYISIDVGLGIPSRHRILSQKDLCSQYFLKDFSVSTFIFIQP